MNGNTVSLIERPYQEVVDDLLTRILGGVVGEAIVHDVTQNTYALAEQATALRAVRGQRIPPGGTRAVRYEFRLGIDVGFDEGRNAVVWLDGGVHPDDNSTFYVDYLRAGVQAPLTDLTVGSVTRILAEAVGRELAVVYGQIDEAYRAGFLDTARGTALDLVVAILGVERKRASFAVGLVTFFRAAGADGAVVIPVALQLRTSKGAAFEVSDARTLQPGVARIDVPVRAAPGSAGDVGRVGPGEITVLAQTLAGIDHVSNADATVLGAADETDEQLRARARAALGGLGRATLAALAQAVLDAGGKLIEAWDPASTTRPAPVGTVTLLVEAEPERLTGIQQRVAETRAAGIMATVVARYVFVTPRIALTVTGDVPPAGRSGVVGQVIAALQAYVDSLGAAQPAEGAAMLATARAVPKVAQLIFVDVLAFRTDVAESGPDALVDALVAATATGAGDQAALRAAFLGILAAGGSQPPSGARIPDRSVIRGPSGAPATDAEIEAGTFSVVPPTDGTWWVALDLSADDVAVA